MKKNIYLQTFIYIVKRLLVQYYMSSVSIIMFTESSEFKRELFLSSVN